MSRVILQKLIIFLVCSFIVESTDILNLFRPKPDLPQELNNFLTDVQRHKKDFAFIRNVAKNRRKYEKSYEENHNLFAEDLDNQLTLSPYYNKRFNNFDSANLPLKESSYAHVGKPFRFERENNLRSYYPNERYSKFVRSPVRLQRELDANYIDTRVKIDPNGIYGEIQRPDPKLPGLRLVDDENKYRTGHVIGMEEEDSDSDDYDESRPTEKRKREVEISIKSDGKLVKRIEEDENGPKSIVLNIKASDSNEKSQLLDNSVSKAVEHSNGVSSAIPVQPLQNNKNVETGPSNSKTIPSLTNANSNQNRAQNKNIGVPINSIPASNNGFANNENEQLNQKDDESQERNGKESVNPEVSKVSNSENVQKKIDLYNSKMGGANKQPDDSFDNLRWAADGNQMAKSIDIAQNNVNRFSNIRDKPNMMTDLKEPNKESEFEKIQGVVVDDTNINDYNIKDNKIKYTNKRQSIKNKRWDDLPKSMDDGNYIPVDLPVHSKDTANGGFNYAEPLEQEALALGNSEPTQHNPERVQWETEAYGIHLNPNEKYEVIEHSTRDILILPIIETTPCDIEAHTPDEAGSSEEEQEEEEEAKELREAVEQEIKKEKEETEIKHEHEEDSKSGASETHQGEKEVENCKHESNKDPREEIGVANKDLPQGHHHTHENHKSRHELKRQVVAKKKKTKYIIKQPRKGGRSEYSPEQDTDQALDKSKREQETQNDADDDALRNRKHLPPIPKYKRKRVRQHPKKRINRIEKAPLIDYYAFNEIYGPPDDTFDFIPSFYQRQLKSANYEFDPNLILDIGDHDQQEIKKFEQSEEEKDKKKKVNSKEKDEVNKKYEKSEGHRKKFKSDGDYPDEEELPTFKSILKNVPLKKTLNRFAPINHATTEDNDDDYNYEDLTDMEDEEEDVAYEEENTDDVKVDEQIGNETESENDGDRLTLNNFMAAYLALPKVLLEFTTKKSATMETFSYSRYLDEELTQDKQESEDEEGHDEDEQVAVRGHGSSKTKRKKKKKVKKKPKRNNENDGIVKTDMKNLVADLSSFHGRGNLGFKLVKHKQIKPKRQDFEPINQKRLGLSSDVSDRLEGRPLSNQQKQDIFLRYNPDFQRWPRFVQNDNLYRTLMRKRALENQKKYLRNARKINHIPISNEYFLNPERLDFVKREEPTVETTTAAESSGSTEAAVSSIAPSVTASSAAPEAEEGTATAESFAEQKEQVSETTPNMETESAAAQDNFNGGATLPQAAKNILQTANSDLFENTTAPSLESVENSNISSNSEGERSTQFQFTTNADDLTENTQCMTNSPKEVVACPDESANHSPATVTSVLPLLAESATLLKVNMTKSEYLDLNDIVGGSLPIQIVSHSLSNAKGNIRQGLNSGKFNMNLNLANYNSSAETKMILNEMTKLMMKLKYHTTCQELPANLKTYIKLITKNEIDNPMGKIKEMDEIDFDEHQSSYVFHGSEGDSIQNKGQALKELLNKYNGLPDNCKERAEPVKEYIESHLAMIDGIRGKGSSKAPAGPAPTGNGTSDHPKAKKEISSSNSNKGKENDLDAPMMEEGLNNQKPDANEAIEDKDKKNKREASDAQFPPVFAKEISTSTSPQYGKLAEAVRKLRSRRAGYKRIGEIYGRAKREEEIMTGGNEESKREDKGFESPLVIHF